MLKVKYILFFILILVVFACGGGSGSSSGSAGKIFISIKWPQATKGIPVASNSIEIILKDSKGVVVQNPLIVKPAEQWVSDSLANGSYSLSAIAFPTTQGTGVRQAVGSAEVTLREGQNQNVNLVMGTTVKSVTLKSSGNTLDVDKTMELVAECKDEQGSTVLVDPSTLHWNSTNSSVVTVDARGKVVAVSPGSSNITATFVEVEASMGQSPIKSSDYPIRVNYYSLDKVLTGHAATVNSISISKNGQIIASGSSDRTVRVWSTSSGQQLLQLVGHFDTILAVAISNNGDYVASASADGKVKLWRLQTGELVWTSTGNSGRLTCLAFSPDGSVLLSGSQDGFVRGWDINSGVGAGAVIFSNQINSIALSPDGKLVACGLSNSTTEVRDWPGGLIKMVKADQPNVVLTTAFSSGGSLIASGGLDKIVRVFSSVDGSVQRLMEGHSDIVSSLIFLNRQNELLTGSWDGTLKVWDYTTGENKSTLYGHTGKILSVSTDSTSNYIVSCGTDATIRLWIRD
jgi:WD40 repeat protein